MAKYKKYNYSQTVLLPVSLSDQLMPGTLEFAIHTLVEERMDMSRFDAKFKNDETGRKAYDPKVLLKAVLLAYSRGIIHSRKIERACKENVVFMALTCGQYPDHSTIAAFVSSMQEEIKPLFRDVLLVCEEMDLLGGTEFALDGLKLSSNASKEWSGTIGDLTRKKEKLESKVQQFIQEQQAVDQKEETAETDKHRRRKQIEKLQKQSKRIADWLSENEAKIGWQGKEIKSNITDNDSAKMMTSHGTIQGYNSQALVDAKHQIIVQAEASGDGQDHHHIPPLIDSAKETMQALEHGEDYFEGTIFTADSNYHSEENLRKCEEEKLEAYIPDRNFRARDPRFATQERHRPKKDKKFTQDDFTYNQADNTYTCPQGKTLRCEIKNMKQYGNIYRRYVGNSSFCGSCEKRQLCIRKNGAKKYLVVLFEIQKRNLSKKMAAKIETERGRKLYPHRTAIVEPVFANVRINKKMDCFTLRGKVKVNIQWLLYCMLHNIEKITNFGGCVATT